MQEETIRVSLAQKEMGEFLRVEYLANCMVTRT